MNGVGTSMRELYLEREGKRKRASSYDRTGGNSDFFQIEPGRKRRIFDADRPGCITHIWVTMGLKAPEKNACLEREVVIRMFWDNEDIPSVEAPIGDFFGIGHGISKNFSSAPLTMCPQDGRGYNCFFPMPYSKRARIEIENESFSSVLLFFYVDYEEYEKPVESRLRFHAKWKREIVHGINDSELSNEEYLRGGYNITGDDNYVILEARGKGHYVGCNINIHNLRYTSKSNWYGEGDDMIFIDDEPWPPRLHGTGMEDYFNTAFCPKEEYCSLYSGITLAGGPNYSGKVSYYRYHIEDPVMFEKSIKVTIEHGHNNHREDDYSSTAYWYQMEPHIAYEQILPASNRLPLDDTEKLDAAKIQKIRQERDEKAKEMGISVDVTE